VRRGEVWLTDQEPIRGDEDVSRLVMRLGRVPPTAEPDLDAALRQHPNL
jgi:hypothetical protein